MNLADKNGNEGRGKIRLQIQWIYSRFQYFDAYVTEWQGAIKQDIEDLAEAKERLSHMEQPFGFLDTV